MEERVPSNAATAWKVAKHDPQRAEGRPSHSPLQRNDWPLARVTRAQADSDGMVRRVDLVTVRGGSRRHYKRPVTETILLPSETQ